MKFPAPACPALGGTEHAPVTCNANCFLNITCSRSLAGFFNEIFLKIIPVTLELRGLPRFHEEYTRSSDLGGGTISYLYYPFTEYPGLCAAKTDIYLFPELLPYPQSLLILFGNSETIQPFQTVLKFHV